MQKAILIMAATVPTGDGTRPATSAITAPCKPGTLSRRRDLVKKENCCHANRLDKRRHRRHDWVMNKRRRRSLPGDFWIWLTWIIFSVATNLTAAETISLPSVNSNFMLYRYSQNDLGPTYTPQSTTLKLWAPTSSKVEVALFEQADSTSFSATPMTCDRHGIWSVTMTGNLDGKYYRYQIALPGADGSPPTVVQVNDPYARGCSANTGKTLIYEPAKTNPEGWEQDQYVRLRHNVDAVLYEVHVRDFSINRNSGIAQRGKFLGMVETGTRTAEGQKSGLDHLAELGITHVHLLPVNDYAGGDERQKADEYTWYNWGYDPVLYATPEGSYAREPDGTARQREFKQLVQTFHQHQIGVVVDVVFNHTASTGSGLFPSSTRFSPDTITAPMPPATTPMEPAAGMNSPRNGPWPGNSSWIASSIG